MTAVGEQSIEAEFGLGYNYDYDYDYGAKFTLSDAAIVFIEATNLVFKLIVRYNDVPPGILQRLIHSISRQCSIEDLCLG